MSIPLDLPLAFVDLETTGANAESDRITEIGIITVDGDTTSEWSQLVQPGVHIPDFIATLTGISDAMVASAPRFETLAEEVRKRLDGHLFIAHNARFDFGFLRREFKRIGMEFRAPVVCTVKLSRRLYPQHHKHNLDSLIARHGIIMESRHRALADARAISQFWQIARKEVAPERFAEAIQKASAQSALPAQIDPQEIDALPEGHGVYVFRDDNGTVQLLGASKTVRKRVLAHFATDAKKPVGKKSLTTTTSVEGIACSGEIGARLLEARMLSTLPTSAGVQPRRCFTWHLREEQHPGEWQAQLLEPEKYDASATPGEMLGHMFGLFRTAREARTRLLELIHLNSLCPALIGLEPRIPGSPCSGQITRRCKGACVGKEPIEAHRLRVVSCLEKLRIPQWPFSGAAYYCEQDTLHVFDAWRYLGSTKEIEQARILASGALPRFSAETYRILERIVDQFHPLTGNPACTVAESIHNSAI